MDDYNDRPLTTDELAELDAITVDMTATPAEVPVLLDPTVNQEKLAVYQAGEAVTTSMHIDQHADGTRDLILPELGLTFHNFTVDSFKMSSTEGRAVIAESWSGIQQDISPVEEVV